MSKIFIIGGGISGLSAAAYLSKNNEVILLEKNSSLGGRARVLEDRGFKFDMGPSWYWMPDVFEKFFNDFNYTTSDFYELIQLNPAFQVIFDDGDVIQVPADSKKLADIFEKYERGSRKKLMNYLNQSKLLYDLSMNGAVDKPYLNWSDYLDKKFLNIQMLSSLFRSVSGDVRKYFHHSKLRQLLEFPVIFLGSTADKIPALYHLMNYACFKLGTWYPMGGMYEIIKSIHKIGLENNAQYFVNTEVKEILVKNKKVIGIRTDKDFIEADIVISSADYTHTENNLIKKQFANYNEKYWERKTFAPSALIFYLGVNKKLPRLIHHNLFFDADFNKHIHQIYSSKQWPDNPLFYVSVPSKTDNIVSPSGYENIFILIPIALGLKDDENIHEQIFNNVINRIEKFIGEKFSENIIVKHKYSVSNFIKDYNAYKGNAYGLANTLFQTAGFKPKMRNKNISNLFYIGQLTVPGPGVPPSLISGKIVSNLISKYFPSTKIKNKQYETFV